MSKNPFDELGLPTDAEPAELTERLREMMEDATSDAERNSLRAAWEELTLHADRRTALAAQAFPTGKVGRRGKAPKAAEIPPEPAVSEEEFRWEPPLAMLVPSDAHPSVDVPIERDPLIIIDEP